MSYKEFSKWMGNCIHTQDGLYFRHDSQINPEFEKARRPKLLSNTMTTIELYNQFVKKIEHQWKTLQAAFSDLCFTRTGYITKEELLYYIKHWGLVLDSDSQLNEFFGMFDCDGDGKISFDDFKQSLGKIIHPVDEPYFRVEVKSKLEFLSCKIPKCTFMKVGFMNLCAMHLKLSKNKAVKIILRLQS